MRNNKCLFGIKKMQFLDRSSNRNQDHYFYRIKARFYEKERGIIT